VLSIVGQADGLCLPELLARSEQVRGQAISEALVHRLVARGLLQAAAARDEPGRLQLTAPGRLVAMEMMAIRKSSEADVQGKLDPSEVQLLKHLLGRLERSPQAA
jgi:3-hydroxy-9,10-secoandrosta-1,3,5(10)-triene-9,17-dione monooxygenase reductase component